VTGDRGEVVINAVSGLGDRLVAGEVDGEQWSVRSGEAVRADGAIRALSPDQALVVAGLARDVDTHFGAPQDIEWAIADGEVHLLQARPVTALPRPQIEIPIQIPGGYWEREASHAPRPWSPLTSSLTYEARNPALRQIMADFGLLIDAIEFREIGGWEYVRTVPLGGKDRPPPPAWLMPIVIRLVPAMRARIRQAVAAVRSDDAGALVDRWRQEWHPELKTRIASVRSVEMSTLSDTELIEHYSSAIEILREGPESTSLSTPPPAWPWPGWCSPRASCWAGKSSESGNRSLVSPTCPPSPVVVSENSPESQPRGRTPDRRRRRRRRR
jgi:pyruvate,water dikinase